MLEMLRARVMMKRSSLSSVVWGMLEKATGSEHIMPSPHVTAS